MKFGLCTVLCLLTCWAAAAIAQPEMRLESHSASTQATCKPAALISGEASLVSELNAELERRGVAIEDQVGCPSISATVETIEAGYFVSVKDTSGRNAYRRIGNLQIAATWIDSWLSEDLGAPLLAVRTVASKFSSAPRAAAPLVDLVPTTAPRRAAPRWTGSLRYESATASNAAPWQGIGADLCARFSFACLGLSGHVAKNTDASSLGDGFSLFHQSSIDLLASARIPIALGRTTLSPGLAFGAGRLRSERAADIGCTTPLMDPASDCLSEFSDGLPRSRVSWAPRVEAGLSLALPISSAVHLELGGSADFRPLGAQAIEQLLDPSQEPLPPEPMPCPNDPQDPLCTNEPISLLAMPADPEFFWRLSIGLQVRL